jgi:hypothetical protein
VFIREIRGYFPAGVHQQQSAAKVLAFPHKSVKAAACFEAQAAVEFHGLGIGFCHSKAQAQEVAGAQLLRAQSEQGFSYPAATKLRQDTNLRYMTNIFTDARTQQESGNRPRWFVQRHERGMRVKDAASWKTDNIIQEAQRTVEAPILIVDFGINVAAIRRGDYRRAGLKVLLSPAAKLDIVHCGYFRTRAVAERQRHK